MRTEGRVSSFFSAYSQARLEALAQRDREGLLTFKNSKNEAQHAEPIPCAVAPDRQSRAAESEEGAQLQSVTHWLIKVDLGTVYNAAWRAYVTYPNGETIEYHLKAGGTQYSNASQLVIFATKVN